MSLRSGGVRLACRAVRQVEVPFVDLPAFLCPGLLRTTRSESSRCHQRQLHSTPERPSLFQQDFLNTPSSLESLRVVAPVNKLPHQCSGCGALTQTLDKDEPGFFDLKRKSVKQYLMGIPGATESKEDVVFRESIQRAKENNPYFVKKFGFNLLPSREGKCSEPSTPDSTNVLQNL